MFYLRVFSRVDWLWAHEALCEAGTIKLRLNKYDQLHTANFRSCCPFTPSKSKIGTSLEVARSFGRLTERHSSVFSQCSAGRVGRGTIVPFPDVGVSSPWPAASTEGRVQMRINTETAWSWPYLRKSADFSETGSDGLLHTSAVRIHLSVLS